MPGSFVDRWLNRLKASAREEIQETARTALLFGVASVSAVLAIVFLTLAAMWWLEFQMTPVSAALLIAGFYVLVAVVVLVWAMWGRGRTPAEATPPPHEAAPVAPAGLAMSPDMPARMGVDIEGVAQTLKDAGFRAEAVIVTASSDVLRQLTPLQFVSLVFVGSFLFGRRLRRRL